MSEELPYKTEYAKSGRAGCKGCKMNIGQGTLRLAVMVQVTTKFSYFIEKNQCQPKIHLLDKCTKTENGSIYTLN